MNERLIRMAPQQKFDKYIIETDFFELDMQAEEEDKISLAELETARAEAFAEGKAQGYSSGKSEGHAAGREEVLNALAQQIAAFESYLQQLHKMREDYQHTLAREAMHFVHSVLATLVPALCEQYPQAQLENILTRALRGMDKTQHILMELAPASAQLAQTYEPLQTLLRQYNVVLQTNETLSLQQVRLSWGQQGLSLDTDTLLQEVLATVKGAQTAVPQPLPQTHDATPEQPSTAAQEAAAAENTPHATAEQTQPETADDIPQPPMA